MFRRLGKNPLPAGVTEFRACRDNSLTSLPPPLPWKQLPSHQTLALLILAGRWTRQARLRPALHTQGTSKSNLSCQTPRRGPHGVSGGGPPALPPSLLCFLLPPRPGDARPAGRTPPPNKAAAPSRKNLPERHSSGDFPVPRRGHNGGKEVAAITGVVSRFNWALGD